MRPKFIKSNEKTYLVNSNIFAYDGCHKIYILEDDNDLKEAKKLDYDVFPIEEIEDKYNQSCSLKFISTWKLENVCPQFETPVFVY